MGAGKTTAIRAISEIEPISTEALNTTRDVSDKETTTVAFDYGQITLDGGDTLRLFGTPGQDRFSPVWQVLAEGALGVIILLDHSRDDAADSLAVFLDAFEDLIHSTCAIVGLTHLDQAIEKSLDPYYEQLEARQLITPVLPVDPRQADEVSMLLDALLTILESSLDDGAETEAEAAVDGGIVA